MFSRVKLIAALFLLAMTTSTFAADQINVFAAASLKNALDEVSVSWKADTTKNVTLTYAASNALAKQIEAGAPADIFVSADLTWMKYLIDKNLIAVGSDVKLLGNQIVLRPKHQDFPMRLCHIFQRVLNQRYPWLIC